MDTDKSHEIRTELVDALLGFIEVKVTLTELLNKNEAIRKQFNGRLPKDLQEVVNKLNTLDKDLQGSTKKQLSKEAITFIIDDLLLQLTK